MQDGIFIWRVTQSDKVLFIGKVKVLFCHNKPLFRARSEGLGRLSHSVYCGQFVVHFTVGFVGKRLIKLIRDLAGF